MKVWHVIVFLLLIAIILVLGIKYIELFNEYNILVAENNDLIEEIENVENIDENIEEDTEIIKEEKEDLFYSVVKNNISNYRIYDYNKTKKENVNKYINILSLYGLDIPVFSNVNELDANYLNRLLKNIISMNDVSSIIVDGGNIAIHENFMKEMLEDIFGKDFDENNINLEDSDFYPLDGYDDIYVTSSYVEWSELHYADYLITDYKENDENIEVTLIEYCLDDEGFVLSEGETTKRGLYNNKSELIKEYDVEAIETGDYVDLIIKDNGNVVTEANIEKYILDNKDKFEMKKLTFKEEYSKLKVVSCEIVK